MLPFEERLEQFGQIAAASIDELIALTQSAPATESTIAAQAMLGRYGRLVAQIGEVAAQQHLGGLHAVSALVETNILLLQDDKRALTPDEAATLEAWPMLLLGYLANRADREASTALLQSLSSHWPITLPLESATDELRLLMRETGSESPAPATTDPTTGAPEEPANATMAPATEAPEELAPPGMEPAAAAPEALAHAVAEPVTAAAEQPAPAAAALAPAITEPVTATADELADTTAEPAVTSTEEPAPATAVAAVDAALPTVVCEPEFPPEGAQPDVLAENPPAGPETLTAWQPPAPTSDEAGHEQAALISAGLAALGAEQAAVEPELAADAEAPTPIAVAALAAEEPAALAEPAPEPSPAEDVVFAPWEPPAPTLADEVPREDAALITAGFATLDDEQAALEPEPAADAEAPMPVAVTALAAEEPAALAEPAPEPSPTEDVAFAEHPEIASTIAAELDTVAAEAPAFAEAIPAAADATDAVPDEVTPQPAASAEAAPEVVGLNNGGVTVAGTQHPPVTEMQHVTQSMLDILLDELKPLNEAFESVIAEATQGSEDERLVALGELLDFMERLKLTVETIGLTALAALLARIKFELVLLPDGLSEDHHALLSRLPRAMMAYLQAPDAPAAAAGLVILLADNRWSTPLAGNTLAAWRAALANIKLSKAATTIAPSPAAAEEFPAAQTPHEATSEILAGHAVPEAVHPGLSSDVVSPAALAAEEPAAAAEAVHGESPAADTGADGTVAMPEAAYLEWPRQEAEPPQAETPQAEPPQAEHLEVEPADTPAMLAGDAAPALDALAEAAPAEMPPAGSPFGEPALAVQSAPERQPATLQDNAVSAVPVAIPAAGEQDTADALPLPLPETGTQYVERPMVEILLEELQPLYEEFKSVASSATQGSTDERVTALGDLLDFLERVKLTVESIGLTALSALLSQVGMEIVSLPEGLTEQHLELLHDLPDAVTAYLRAPMDATACAGLVALAADSRWRVAAPEEARAAWCSALANMELSETSANQPPPRATEATPEDVSLQLPDEVNSELLEGLLQELPIQVSAFSSAVSSITGPGGTLKDTEQAMRAAHTLKGAANTVGIPGIANLTHQLEDILVALGEAERLPQGKLANVLIDAGDCLEGMSEFLLEMGPAPDNAQAILQQVLDMANRIDRESIEGVLGPVRAAPAVASALEAAPSQTAPASRTETTEAEATDPKQAPQTAMEHSLRVPAPLVDELLSLAGESLISNSQLQDHLKSTIIQNRAVHQQHQLILKLVAELETLVDIRGITSQQQGAEHGDGFDSLEFEHYNELQTISRQLMEATTDAREMSNMAEQELGALEEVLGDQQRLQMANQHALLRTRMMPVSNIIARLQRSVRQTGRLLDKEVEFTIKGEGTRMDTSVLNDLMDPLMHMLRNAVDHGIEKPEVRVAAGKSPEGHIELAFAREGDTIVVRCRDDGAGLDHEAIRRIAESKGMIVPGHIHTNEELARLILMPGFSTRDETSQVSGRGVGMDVVYSRVQKMKGLLSLDSQKGKGLTIELRLPATLLSMHALIIRQRERRFAISTRGIEDIRYVPRDNVVEIGARQFVRDGDKIYGLLRLEQALAMPHDRRAKDRAGHPVLLLRMEDGTERAVLVQEVLESREIVMKKFNRFVPQVNGVIGAAILGNGEVAPVIDLFELLHAPMRQLASVQRTQGARAAGAVLEEKPKRALVVDDSLSARRAVVQLLKDEGYEIRTANDGLEAVSVLDKWIPDIIISDMEMPRMNGLELTANIRHTEQTKDVPVIMITSRSTAKHRQMSAAAGVNLHLIKPFSDDELVTQVSKLTEKA